MSFKNKVVYQIYPKSFYDSDGDGYGDLNGITQKLDYLHQLGVDMLWLTPTFISPQIDNGYDVADYRNIDPRYGTMKDMEDLIKEAKKYNIGIMLDMVMNHTSTEHAWFKKALAGDPKYKDYYIWRKGKSNETPPTNWISKFGGGTWEYVERYDEYYLHLFAKEQADLNWDNPEVRREMTEIVDFWMMKGVGGFRFDVINLISKPPIMIDDYEGDGRRFYTDGENVHKYLKQLNNQSFGRDARIMTVGEMSSTNLKNCIKYAGANEQELQMVFNFHHLKVDYKDNKKWELKKFDFSELKELLFSWQQAMQEHNSWMALFWNNHDQPRANSRFGNVKKYHVEVSKMLATAIHMMRGTPYIYQGEEIGMTNAYFESMSEYRDVESLNYYDILRNTGISEKEIIYIIQERSRDNARTPMQWNSEANAGFSKNKPWINPIFNYKDINVKIEIDDEKSVFTHYQKLIQLRKSYEVIQHGEFIAVQQKHSSVLAYKRLSKTDELLVISNFYDEPTNVELEDIEGFKLLLSNYPNRKLTNHFKLAAYESVVFYRNKQ